MSATEFRPKRIWQGRRETTREMVGVMGEGRATAHARAALRAGKEVGWKKVQP